MINIMISRLTEFIFFGRNRQKSGVLQAGGEPGDFYGSFDTYVELFANDIW